LPVAIDVARQIEKYRYDGQSLDRRRAQRPHAWHAADGVLYGSGDEDLDLLRRQPDGLGLDTDLGRRKLRKHIIPGTAEGVDAICNDNAGECGDNTAEPDREPDERRLRTGGKSGAHF
jgi:hypothetical protein